MIKPIMKDVMFLSRKSENAVPADVNIADDLIDTLKAHSESCVGMAANMIGVNKRIIVINVGILFIEMFNPVILKQSMPYETEEGCLSLVGKRKTKRFNHIEVKYQDRNFKTHTQEFSGWTAQIIQHEIDHFDGIII